MARLVVAVAIVGILVIATVILLRVLRAAVAETDRGERFDMGREGMLPKLAYGILLALIVYASLTAGGS